ncbi:hypothetical protein CRM22_008954 [Opisthorchis felineus]|uniref:UPF0506 domain-containing protein n=1 Tax=Opisthorchis felineus TaxID=147828 RepID=A0A4S2LFZ6_OPIFE|nr:hypothetical protein CRM22_008954 [Opisthorchis felineus]
MNRFWSLCTLCIVLLVTVFAQEEEGNAEASQAPADAQAPPEASTKPSKGCIPKDGNCTGTLIKACCGSLVCELSGILKGHCKECIGNGHVCARNVQCCSGKCSWTFHCKNA